jgi:hypothetical protein
MTKKKTDTGALAGSATAGAIAGAAYAIDPRQLSMQNEAYAGAVQDNLAHQAASMVGPAPVAAPPDTDWSKPVEYRAWFLPYNVGTGVDHVFILGGHVATGVQVSGVVKAITLHPNGCVHVRVEVGGKGGVCKYITVKEGHGEQL